MRRPRARATEVSSSTIWLASSRVGARTRPERPWPGSIRSTIGIPKASGLPQPGGGWARRAGPGSIGSTIGSRKGSVFPEPVGDWTSRSWPASASLTTICWTGNGAVMSRSASASTTGLEMPRSANDFKIVCSLLCDSGRFRSPKTLRSERRKRNLSGGGGAKPDQDTVAGCPIWPAFWHFSGISYTSSVTSALPTEPTYTLYRRGLELLEDGDFVDAAEPLAEAARRAPEKSSVREALGRAHHRAGRFAKAAVEVEAVVECHQVHRYA